MKHSKHDWILRHSINEALRAHSAMLLALHSTELAMRNGYDEADPVTKALFTALEEAYKNVRITSSGCDDDVLLFVLTKRE